MAKERYINTKFWDDSYIIKLDPTEKLLFIYLLTNPLTNIAGVYEITPRRIAFDIGIDTEMIENILKRFELDKKMFYRDGWLIICNFPKYQQYENNLKIKQGIDHILSHLPDSIRKDIDNLSIPYAYLTNYSNPNPNPNPNLNPNLIDIPAQLAKKFFSEPETFNAILEEFSKSSNIPAESLAPEAKKFGLYWTERNKSGTKQRWETEKTFEVKRRLFTWFSNVSKFNKTKSTKVCRI